MTGIISFVAQSDSFLIVLQWIYLRLHANLLKTICSQEPDDSDDVTQELR